MNYPKTNVTHTALRLAAIALLVSASLNAATLVDERYEYVNGPLAGQGPWARGVTSPSADNPSNHIVVENGAVKFDWTTPATLNNAVRLQWAEDQMTTGTIYASFQLRVTQAPQLETESRPGFLHFDRSGGGQMRGHVGIRRGTEPDTFQIGISPNSQLLENFTFSEADLALNAPVQVMVGYDIASAKTFLWIGTSDPTAAPEATAEGSPSAGVRRVQLRLYNSDGAGGTTDHGIFYIDDLQVTTGAGLDPEPEPEPDTAEVFLAETFAYPNGPILDSAPDWRVREGIPAHFVLANTLQLQQSAADGYITRNLTRTIETGPVYAAFTLYIPDTIAETAPANILHLTDTSGAFGRAYVTLEGTTNGWRIGLRTSAAGDIQWESSLITAGSTSRWAIGFDVTTGSTSLWKDGDAPDALPRVQVEGTPMQVRRIAIAANPNLPAAAIGIRDLHLASTLTKAVSAPVDIISLPHRDKVFLFLLIGQSNMAGRGAIADQDRIGDRRIVYYNADQQWQVARDPLHWDRPAANGVGPALSFARSLLADLPPDAVIGLIPAAQGGTSITWWQKTYAGSNRYYDDQYLYPHALARALAAAQQGTLTGILWNQGENDAGAAEADGGASYRTRLHQLIADLRSDLGIPELPFISSTLGPWRTNATAINNVFLNLPSEVPETAAVNTNDPIVAPFLLNNPSDTPHYISSSYRLLGELYAEAFQPWWQPESAYVSTIAGNISAGGTNHRIDFSTTGAVTRWQVAGIDLLAAGTSSTGEWLLQGASGPESTAYSANPPLSFKWRSPRTMAAWSVSNESIGVILANNDLAPAVFSLSLSDQYLTAFRTTDGNWNAIEIALEEQPVDRLKWSLPDGTHVLWRGSAALLSGATGGTRDLAAQIESGSVIDWHWQQGKLTISEPQPHAVYQRQSERKGRVPFEGIAPVGTATVAFRITAGSSPFGPVPVDPVLIQADPTTGAFAGSVNWPSGGWYSIEMKALDVDGGVIDESLIDPIGIGEVFVVAGQSNATNSGQFPTRPQSGLVAAFSGSSWRPASDPMPGTHDNAMRGSFQPSMGDALVAQYGVPVGFASTGQGGSAIRHWQPDYEPNFTSNTFYNGLFQWTLHRMRQLGPNGFRALLWHQGESDAARGESTDPTKVDRYYDAMSRLLGLWRADAGWHFPAFTAKASLWPMTNAAFGGDPYLREAQQRIWDDGIALPGPDTDQLGLEFRQDDSDSRVHFNAEGLNAHGELWADAVIPFIDSQNLLSLLPDPLIDLTPTGPRIQWAQVSGIEIQLQSSSSPSGDWNLRQSFTSDQADAVFEYRDTSWNPSQPQFYRIQIHP